MEPVDRHRGWVPAAPVRAGQSRQPLPRRAGEARAGALMSRIAVVTSTPPMAEGGHMVIARALARALEEHGHEAGVVLTPQNRFGKLASSYVATWFTDVGRTGDGRPVDQ